MKFTTIASIVACTAAAVYAQEGSATTGAPPPASGSITLDDPIPTDSIPGSITISVISEPDISISGSSTSTILNPPSISASGSTPASQSSSAPGESQTADPDDGSAFSLSPGSSSAGIVAAGLLVAFL